MSNPTTRDIANGFTGNLAEPIAVQPGKQVTIGFKVDGGTYDVLVGLTDDNTDLITLESGITADYVKSSLAGFKWVSLNVTVTPTTSTQLQVLNCASR
jgi:hypothetical protein